MELKDIRKALGWNKKQAYTYLGCSFLTYDRYEDDDAYKNTGRYKDYVQRLSFVLGRAEKKSRLIDCTTDDFAFIRQKGAYYVDKSLLIKEILDSGDSAILFARPCRFGKSLNLSMIRHFFDMRSSKSLFDGLAISECETLCKEHQNKYPVLYMSFKDVEGLTFEDFITRLSSVISYAVAPFAKDVQQSDASSVMKDYFKRLINQTAGKEELRVCLFHISSILHEIYGQKAILLIDEYDVPLQKASTCDYYDKALDIISGLFSMGFKSNTHLFLGIATGCLKVSKETIFTGLNNVSAYTLLDVRYKNSFGFTEEETKQMLLDFGLSDHEKIVRDYYDGYPGKGTSIYCPFDVVHYVSDHLEDRSAAPIYYWMNTSENEIIHALLNVSDSSVRDEIDALVQGAAIEKEVDLHLTYRDLYKDPQNIYSVLLSSGYLVAKEFNKGKALLSIPNEEVRYIFSNQIAKWIDEKIVATSNPEDLANALLNGNFEKSSQIVSEFLWNTIGIHDYARQKKSREGFYHGLLLGLLSGSGARNYQVKSNPESGDGFVDIALVTSDGSKGVLIECKYAAEGDFEASAAEALSQIEEKRYAGFFLKQTDVKKVAAVFYQKRCLFVRG